MKVLQSDSLQEGKLIQQPGGEISLNSDGSSSAVCTFIFVRPLPNTLVPVRNRTPHPYYPQLLCSSWKIIQKEGSQDDLVVSYTGYFGNAPRSQDDRYTRRVTWSTTLETVPIEASSNFGNIVGVPPDGGGIGLNGSIFDSNLKFVGWLPSSRFSGLESFLLPQQTLVVEGSFPAQDGWGLYTPPPSLPLVGRFNGGNFCTAAEATIDGAVWRYKYEFLLGKTDPFGLYGKSFG